MQQQGGGRPSPDKWEQTLEDGKPGNNNVLVLGNAGVRFRCRGADRTGRRGFAAIVERAFGALPLVAGYGVATQAKGGLEWGTSFA